MSRNCPHCILRKIEKKSGIKFSDDFKVGFQLGALFYPELVRKNKK